MKKLAFVIPRMPWQYNPYSDPPLGLLQVAAVAKKEKKDQLEVQLLDLAHDELSEADYFAMGGTTLEFPTIVETAEKIKKEFSNSKILAGGVHFDVFPKDYWEKEINKLPFDAIGLGEGEANIIPILDYLETNHEKKVFIQHGPLLDLSALPFQARELLDKNRYFKSSTFTDTRKSTGEGGSATIMASRGCPFDCSFCASPEIHQHKLRFKNLDKIKEELISLRKLYGVRDLRWQDDNFPLTLKKLKGLEYFLFENDFRYRSSLRVDEQSSNDYVLTQLWYSGCREVGFGLESGEDSVLKLNQKETTVEQNEVAIRRAKDRGFLVRAFFMTGLPGETTSSGERTAEFIERNWKNLNAVTLTNFIPLPGTDIYNNPEKYGIQILHKNWKKYNIAITRDFQEFPFVHKINGLSEEDMVQNLEIIKQEVFRRNLSNVSVYNDDWVGKPYKSPYL